MLGLLAMCATLGASVAGAAGSAPVVKVGTPFTAGPLAVAVESSGTAVVAWANTKDLGGSYNYVQYCVLAPGATTCSHSGNLIPGGGAQYIDGTQVIVDGGTIVILADVFGAPGNNGGQYEPEQEWQSTDGGATWTLVNGGISTTSANLSADTVPLNAVIVPGTNVLGYGWETAGGPPTFNAFPLVSPPECSKMNPCPFATLEPNTNPDTLTNFGGAFAAQAGAHPGVLGVFSTLFNDGGPFNCPNNTPNGLAFVYGAGNQSLGNSYNVSPGSPGSAWTGAAQQGECGVEYPAIAGGPGGFGLLAHDEGSGTTIFQPFDQSSKSFGAKVRVSSQSELDPALSQDAAGGWYATYLNSGSGGPVALSYSGDGGKSWSGPATLDAYASQSDVTSAVGPTGQGWVTWVANGSVFAQPFTAADAVSPPSASSGGSTNGTTLTITVTCSSFPCTVTVTIVAPPGPARDARATKHPPTVLAKGTFTIRTRQGGKLKLRLTPAGRRFFRAHHGTVGVRASLSQKVRGRVKQRTKTVLIKIVKAKK